MNFQKKSFLLSLHAVMRRWQTWAMLLLILIFSVLIRIALVSPQLTESGVCVGVYAPEGVGEEFVKALESRNGSAVHFVRCDEAALRANVATSQWDCGILVSPDYQYLLEHEQLKKAFTLVTGPGSAVYPLVRETVSAAAIEQLSPYIAADYLLNQRIATSETILTMQPRLKEILPQAQRVMVVSETSDGRPLSPLQLKSQNIQWMLMGAFAMLLLVLGLFSAIDLGRWLSTDVARRLSIYQNPAALMLPRLAASFLPPLLGGIISLLIIFDSDALLAVVALPFYLAALGGFVLLLASCKRVWPLLPALIPFLSVTCFILSPIFIDPVLLFPWLNRMIAWTPVALFVNCARGETAAFLQLLIISGICGFASFKISARQ